MSETRRKLTTIFSADVQDYTRLMGADEEGTLATLRRYRDKMAGLIEAHGGRVINTWGDGLIAEFSSVVEAVRAAIDTQNELAGLNAARPADGRMLFRIGINLGDVIAVNDDIYGDGVNIAARLQASAPPGGIVISNTVYDQVRNKVAVGFDFLGPLVVKNVTEGVPSYAVRIGGAQAAHFPPPRAIDTPEPELAKAARRTRPENGRLYSVMGVLIAGLCAVNILAWKGTFWAAWPILVLAVMAGLRWARIQRRIDRGIAVSAVIGFGIVAINLLSWSGTFWAVWPLIIGTVAIGTRWFMRG